MDKVIHDNECKEYMEGWNANNKGDHYLSNPYSCLAYNGELNRLWEKGFNDNHKEWNGEGSKLPESFSESQIKNAFSILKQKDDGFLEQ